MAGKLSIIGLVSSLFQNINIPVSPFAPPQHASSTKVRVYAGISGSGATESTAGNIPGVALWDGNATFIGKAMGVYNYVIGEGKYYDLEVKGRQLSANYLSVAAFGKDGLCIAAVAVTSPTGYQAGWLGDVGMKCGAPWYPSNLVVPGSDPEARPACVWIDQDSTKHPHTGVTIHLPSFAGAGDGLAKQYNDQPETMCKSLPRFSMWKSRSVHMTLPAFMGGLEFNEDGTDIDINRILNSDSSNTMSSETTAPNDPTGTKLGVAANASALEPGPIMQLQPSKRSARSKRSSSISISGIQPLHDRLVVSNVTCPTHSARLLCESQTSAGPDFVSLPEGLFCDMGDKILWPLCEYAGQDSCFDLDSQTTRWPGNEVQDSEARIELKARSLDVEIEKKAKVYRSVQNWS